MFFSPQSAPLAPLQTHSLWASSAKVRPGRCGSLASVQGQRHLPVLPISDPWEMGRALAFHSWVYLQCTIFSHSRIKMLLPFCVIKVAGTKEIVSKLNTHSVVKSGVSREPTAPSLLKLRWQRMSYICLNYGSNCQVGAIFWLIVLYPKAGTS